MFQFVQSMVCKIFIAHPFTMSTHHFPPGPKRPRKYVPLQELLGAFRGTLNYHRTEFFPLNSGLT